VAFVDSRPQKQRISGEAIDWEKFREEVEFNGPPFVLAAQHGSPEQLRLDDIFRQQDKDVNPSQGLFLYTSVMPCMMLANACSPFGLVNAAIFFVPMVILHVCRY
jgi:hypothetical protein